MALENNDTIKESIITQISEQFSEYDHHNQKLFIQFFSAVFIVLLGYAFVFANQQFLYSGTGTIVKGYTTMHLLAVYVVAQIILIFLSTLILNIGYCFRRDQLVIYNIRKKVFAEEEYRALFGTQANNPLKKGLLKDSYLPTFNALFYRFVVLVQTTLFISLVIAMETDKAEAIQFVHNHPITYIHILAFPIVANLSEYVRFYLKYKNKVDTGGYFEEKINRKISLIQEGWVTLVPLLILFELLVTGVWKYMLMVLVEVCTWGLLLMFLWYVMHVVTAHQKNKLPRTAT